MPTGKKYDSSKKNDVNSSLPFPIYLHLPSTPTSLGRVKRMNAKKGKDGDDEDED